MLRSRRPHWVFVATRTFILSAVLSHALQVSPDGTCGGTTGLTCAGSTWGACCSAHGYCGSGDTYCGKGCDLSAGTCNPGQGTPGGAIATKTTGEEGGGTACPVCPVCTICMSPTPTLAPSSCRVILTATRWETAMITKTVGIANGTAMDTTTQTAVSTVTKSPVVTTKTATVTQTLVRTQTQTQILVRTETLTVVGTVAADAVSPTPAAAATPAAAVILESTATPSPILPGIVAGCHRWYKTPPETSGTDDSGGSTCRTVAEAVGITKDDLRLWNTRIGNTSDDTAVCEGPAQLALLASNLCRVRCGELWGGYYLCVGGPLSGGAT